MTFPPASIRVLAWLSGVIRTGPAEVAKVCVLPSASTMDDKIRTPQAIIRMNFILASSKLSWLWGMHRPWPTHPHFGFLWMEPPAQPTLAASFRIPLQSATFDLGAVQ